MINIMKNAVIWAERYAGSGFHYVLFLLALIYLIFCKKESEQKKWLLGYSFLFAAIYIFPLTAGIIMKYCVGSLVYWRMLWILPTTVIMAYTAVRICQKPQKTWMKWAAAAVLTILIACTGQTPYTGADAAFEQAHNAQKLPTDVCQIVDMIQADRIEQTTEERAIVVAPEDLLSYIRQYDASIELAYGRRSKVTKARKRLRRQMNKEEPNFKRLTRKARKVGVTYLVYLADETQDETIQSYGFRKVGTVGTYSIYHDEMQK